MLCLHRVHQMRSYVFIETWTDSADGRAIFRSILLSLAQLYALFQLLLRNGNRGSSSLFVVYEYATLLRQPPGLLVRAGQAAGNHQVQNTDFPVGQLLRRNPSSGHTGIVFRFRKQRLGGGLGSIRLLKIVGVVRNTTLLILRIVDKSTIFRIIISSCFVRVCLPLSLGFSGSERRCCCAARK